MTEVMAQRRLGGGERASRATPLTGASLWRPEDLLRWGITVGVGGIVIAVAWYVCAGEASFAQQIGPTNAAVAGLLLGGAGNTVWLLKGRRALGERRRALLPDVLVPLGSSSLADDTDAGAVDGVGEQHALYVAGDGMERYHRSTCPLAAGRQGWAAMTADRHEAAGRRACGVCLP
jgi:hypothetical protein